MNHLKTIALIHEMGRAHERAERLTLELVGLMREDSVLFWHRYSDEPQMNYAIAEVVDAAIGLIALEAFAERVPYLSPAFGV